LAGYASRLFLCARACRGDDTRDIKTTTLFAGLGQLREPSGRWHTMCIPGFPVVTQNTDRPQTVRIVLRIRRYRMGRGKYEERWMSMGSLGTC
jgi:hypothetical protein